MKVMLINSITIQDDPIDNLDHLYHFPLGLLSLGSVLEENDIDVMIVDYSNIFHNIKKKTNPSHEAVKTCIEETLPKYMEEFKPDVVGVGAIFTSAFGSSIILAETLKKIAPSLPVVLGGIHATIYTKKILEDNPSVDYIILGEGEYTFLELVKNLENKKTNEIPLIDGIGYRAGDTAVVKEKKIFIGEEKEFGVELDELTPVNFNLLNIEDYRFDTSNWYSPKKIGVGIPFPILSSRSCPLRCNFCSMWFVHGPKTRFRSADNVVDEIEYNYKNNGARYFSFVDDNFTLSRKRILEICSEILERGLDIQFDTPNGVMITTLDDEVVSAMVAAGLVKINLSPEHGSDHIRNIVIGKHLESEKIYEVFEACAKHDSLYIGAYFIFGLPEETPETLQETLDMVEKLPIDRLSFSLATPYPGTQLYEYCVENDLLEYDHEQSFDASKQYKSKQKAYFKPHEVSEEQLFNAIVRAGEMMKEKRGFSDSPENHPVRSRQFHKVVEIS